jgi:hypothetical protein
MSKARHARPSKASRAVKAAGTAAVPGVTAAVVLAVPAQAATAPQRTPEPRAVTQVIQDNIHVLAKVSTLDIYQVRPGDSLSRIARSDCGNTADWTGIYERNKSEVKDPDLIYAGQQLILDCADVPVNFPVQQPQYQQPARPDAVQQNVSPDDYSGGTLSYSGLESLWEEAGGPASAAPEMAMIAIRCESGGRQYAENPSGASGYWQILGQVVPGDIFNPMVNAENAVAKYRAGGFSPWSGDGCV